MIDWHHVDDLKQTIGAEAFAEVVVLFLDEADQAIAQLTSAQALPGITKELHGLKGIALNPTAGSMSRRARIPISFPG